jgi:hypothetical protein
LIPQDTMRHPRSREPVAATENCQWRQRRVTSTA